MLPSDLARRLSRREYLELIAFERIKKKRADAAAEEGAHG